MIIKPASAGIGKGVKKMVMVFECQAKGLNEEKLEQAVYDFLWSILGITEKDLTPQETLEIRFWIKDNAKLY